MLKHKISTKPSPTNMFFVCCGPDKCLDNPCSKGKVSRSPATVGPSEVQQKLRPPKNLDAKSLIKIRSVTAEIMLIWTIVARTYMLTEQMLFSLTKAEP